MLKMFKSEVTDDRGHKHPGLNLSELRKLEEGGDQRAQLAERLRLAVKVEGNRLASLRWARIGVAVVVVSVLLSVQAITRVNVGPWFYWMFFGASAIVLRFLTKRQIDQQLSNSALTEGFCGSCGYSMRSTPVEEDGCMACPECGAAWKASRITRAHWDHETRTIDERVGFWEMALFLTPSRGSLTVADDRGRYVRSLDRWMRLLSKEKRDALGEATVAEMKRRLARIGFVRRIVSTLLSCVAIALPFVMVSFVGGGKVPFPVRLIVGITCGVLMLFFVWQGWRGSKGCKPTEVVKQLSAMGICGACGERLGANGVESDGCLVCPSCRAAWRVSPPTGQNA